MEFLVPIYEKLEAWVRLWVDIDALNKQLAASSYTTVVYWIGTLLPAIAFLLCILSYSYLSNPHTSVFKRLISFILSLTLPLGTLVFFVVFSDVIGKDGNMLGGILNMFFIPFVPIYYLALLLLFFKLIFNRGGESGSGVA